jgi:hypothetical protein
MRLVRCGAPLMLSAVVEPGRSSRSLGASSTVRLRETERSIERREWRCAELTTTE